MFARILETAAKIVKELTIGHWESKPHDLHKLLRKEGKILPCATVVETLTTMGMSVNLRI